MSSVRTQGARHPQGGLGVEVLGRRSVVLIPHDAALPARRSRPFTTVADGQRAVEVRVVRCAAGSGRGALIGRFLLAGVRPGPRGAARIDIGLSVDGAGVLRAWARDRATGVREDCVFASTRGGEAAAARAGEALARGGGTDA